MSRNLSRRMEVVAPVCDPAIKAELENILRTYEEDPAVGQIQPAVQSQRSGHRATHTG